MSIDTEQRVNAMPGLSTHPDLKPMHKPGGLFDVEPCEMDLNIGKRGRFISPKCEGQRGGFVVQTVQKDHRGEKCYRVVMDWDVHKFGQVARVSEVEIEKGGAL